MKISHALFYLLCFFIAYSRALQIELGPVTISAPYMIALVGLGALLVNRGLSGAGGGDPGPRIPRLILLFVLLYTAMGLVALARIQLDSKPYSQDVVFRVIEQVGRLILSACITFYVITVARRREVTSKGLTIMAGSAALVAAYGIYQVLGTYGGFYRPLLPRTGSYGVAEGVQGATRAIGTMQEPSFLAGFLCFSVIMTLMLLAERDKTRPGVRLVLFPSLLIQGLCLVMTASTGGFAGLGAALVVALVLLRGAVRRRFILHWALVASLLVGPVIYLATRSRLARELMVATVGKPGHVSAVERTTFVVAALKMFADHPLIGVGPGMYNQHVRQHTSAFSLRRVVIPNNVYAELLSEAGILGFGAFMLVLAAVWRHTLWKWRESGRTDAISAGLLISLVSLMVQFMAYPTFKMEFIWLLFGLALAPWRSAKAGSSPATL